MSPHPDKHADSIASKNWARAKRVATLTSDFTRSAVLYSKYKRYCSEVDAACKEATRLYDTHDTGTFSTHGLQVRHQAETLTQVVYGPQAHIINATRRYLTELVHEAIKTRDVDKMAGVYHELSRLPVLASLNNYSDIVPLTATAHKATRPSYPILFPEGDPKTGYLCRVEDMTDGATATSLRLQAYERPAGTSDFTWPRAGTGTSPEMLSAFNKALDTLCQAIDETKKRGESGSGGVEPTEQQGGTS